MLYRLTDKKGKVAAEGVIPVGTSMPLFRLDLRRKLYISVRMVNYNWSTLEKVHTPRCFQSSIPKYSSLELKGGKMKVPKENHSGR